MCSSDLVFRNPISSALHAQRYDKLNSQKGNEACFLYGVCGGLPAITVGSIDVDAKVEQELDYVVMPGAHRVM